MSQGPSADRRKHVRYPLATTVQFFHYPTGREYPARSIDVSSGGILVYVPATAPVAPGQPIRLQLGVHNRPEFAGLTDRPVDATVVRVDRQRMLKAGHLPVGAQFSQPVS